MINHVLTVVILSICFLSKAVTSVMNTYSKKVQILSPWFLCTNSFFASSELLPEKAINDQRKYPIRSNFVSYFLFVSMLNTKYYTRNVSVTRRNHKSQMPQIFWSKALVAMLKMFLPHLSILIFLYSVFRRCSVKIYVNFINEIYK